MRLDPNQFETQASGNMIVIWRSMPDGVALPFRFFPLVFPLNNRASIAACDGKGQTSSRRAFNCRQLPVIRLLIRRGAGNPNSEDNRRMTPLDVLCTSEMKLVLAET